MRNDEEEISRRILHALRKHQKPKLFDPSRLIFSAIAGFLVVGFFIWESQPRVNITDLDVYHNVRRSSGKNIKMVLDFETAHLKNRSCTAAAYFYYKNGRKVRSTTRGYRTEDNQLSTSDDFRPRYEHSTYKNFTLYIPNKYFNRGSYKGKVKTYCGDEFIGNTKSFRFTIGL
ncbi:hypothetical protein [Oxynema aestuarii]|uniref:Uncharacterized protein n=1 Tax=Oxynema aestuarii AP17 TaxID=2064643 RepID=A0A6H1TVM3_9CYAN|nr:hypothetical protein [Oxynema aestuarii]QIZ70664.1 hypothetical protein HCG48_08795 [Oxynema aestuarii AP17]